MTTRPNPDSTPRIAVLINNFNNGPWLRACVDSVINQTRCPEEVIVYDDGSTDDSLSILRSYGDQVRLIEGEHDESITGIESQARAVYFAFLTSTADHFYLLDGDDAFLPEKISRYENMWAENPDAILVQAPTQLIDSSGNLQREGYEALKHPLHSDFLAATYQTQDTDLYYSTSALAFARAFLLKSLPLNYCDNIALAVDSRLGSIAPLHGQVVCFDETLTLWRQHERSLSRQGEQRTPFAGTLRRHRYFNRYARSVGRRPIHLWRNLRFYRQLGRRIIPRWMTDPLAKNPAGLRPKK
jgi:glycosyltransferase involved in cell wall biosynthesis